MWELANWGNSKKENLSRGSFKELDFQGWHKQTSLCPGGIFESNLTLLRTICMLKKPVLMAARA